MLSTPFICCSSGVATACSNVWASAPTYVARIWISGGAMFGNCATGKLRMVSEPTSTRTIEITIATIGRLMKNFDMTLPAHRIRGEWLGIDPDAGTHFLNSLRNNPITRVQSTCDHPTPIDLRPYRHGPDGHLVVGVEDCHLITTLEFSNRTLRNQQGSAFRPDYCTNLSVATRLQYIVRIGKERSEPNGAG